MKMPIFRFEAQDLDKLFGVMHEAGYAVFGPTVRDQVIVYDQITGPQDLPQGWTDEQEKGRYRLRRRNDQAYFGFNLGPQSWKSQLFSPREKLWSAQRKAGKIEVERAAVESAKKAFFGVRACEISAIAIQDRVFLGGSVRDAAYEQRRSDVLIVAVQCTQAAPTCFCVSMNSGPKVEQGYDLAMTEVLNDTEHFFVIQSGSDFGKNIIDRMKCLRPIQAHEIEQSNQAVEAAAKDQARTLNTENIKDLLYSQFNHPRWDEVAQRCLACANCTMVCPTCFCSSVEDVTDVTGDHTERWRRWESCFTAEHSYVHGGSVRNSIQSRYRQWLTHKLASWIDQFGTSGCVGCGRCVTWCPVGIDLTEEARAIRENQEISK